MVESQTKQQLLIPAYYVQQILEALQQFPKEVASFFAEHKITPESLAKDSALINLETFKQLIVYAMALTQNPSLGLVVGRNLNLTTHGMLGFAVMASRSVREAVTLIAKYLNIRTPLLGLKIIEGRQNMEVVLTERYQLGEVQRPVLESAISALYSMLNQIASDLSPIKTIKFPFNEPSYLSEYRTQFNCELVFSDSVASVVIANRVLDIPLKMGNESAFNNAVALCETELNKLTEEQTVQQKVRSLLLECVEDFPTLEQVANQLHLSPRTMHRSLEKEQTSYSKILADVRYLLAKSMLANNNRAIAEIGRQLGYVEPASFRKAFKNWSKMSPKQYRNQFK